jgi:signal transduction histidine kinase
MRELSLSRSRTAPRLAGALLIGALSAAMLPGRPAVIAVPLAAVGLIIGGAQVAPEAVRLLRRRRSLFLVLGLAGLVIAWVVVGVLDAGAGHQTFISFGAPSALRDGSPFPGSGIYDYQGQTSWPWRVGRLPLWPLVLALLAAVGGFVLVADAVRVQIGLSRPPRSKWRSITTAPSRGGRTAMRAVPGVFLIGLATFLAVSLVNRWARYHSIEETLGMIAISAAAALLLASPVAVGLVMRLDFDKERIARDHERQRFAAHLHDSVLQTLALIQRQAHDADAVAKLARRQEHALRVWMAGEADLGSATVAGALRDMIGDIEDDEGLKVELTAIGDAKLDARNEELVSAAREVLRNVSRHAPGVPVNVFLDVGPSGTELFIRDGGPGFDFAEVPAERRGLRDAVIGRMRFAGGSASVESSPGDGTEVALVLPHATGRTR